MERVFKCNSCSEDFNSLYKLNIHIKRQHEGARERKKKTFKCNVCGHRFRTGRELMNHIRTQTGERPFKCTFDDCGMGFKAQQTLKDHIRYKHRDERPFKCDFPGCLKTAKRASNLKYHKKFHSDEWPFACSHPGCNFRAKVKYDLSRHTGNVHSESKIIPCSKCNFKTKNPWKLSYHLDACVGRSEMIPCSMESSEYKGMNSSAMELHMWHHKARLLCPVSRCGRFALTKEALNDHVELHNPSGRPFQCPLCFKFFKKLVHLQRHCGVHTNEKPLQCGHCEHEAATQTLVKRHISLVHANVEFPSIIHLLDDRECLHCKVTLPAAEFAVHSKGHVDPNVNI